ncbi:MAG TPA: pilin [Candidatus Saccharimonadales bacterium]|nr:pilin [Candidatus Saccharimonadales bacterium]
MFKSLQKIVAGLSITLLFGAMPLAVPAVVSAATTNIGDCLSQGSDLTTGTGTSCQPATAGDGSTTLQNIVTTVLNVFSIVVGIVAVVMIVVGGFKYITSGGESGNITSAKNTIVYAVIGLVVVALAQFIVKFVLNRVSSLGN